VVRGVIRLPPVLVGFEEDFDKDNGKKYCRIKVKRALVPTAPRTCKAFPGWRYLDPAERAPPTCRTAIPRHAPEMQPN